MAPPPSPLQDDPKHWRQLAQHARAAADELDDPDARRTMLEIADGYDQLASIAEKKEALSTGHADGPAQEP
jgi:hypothetical protein